VLTRLTPYLLLAGLALLFFGELVLHPGLILYSDHSDFVVQYLPAKHFLVASWRADGELPLWCPYALAGLPFVHDIQVAAFYPPQAVLYLLPEGLIGPAMSWLIVAHVIIAGWGAYAYARSQGLGTAGSLVTGLGYMFAGSWMLHLLGAGHHPFAPVAWLPLAVLLLERAVRRAGRGEVVAALLNAAWGGAVFGVLCLGAQPQLTFYAGAFLAVWLLGPALEGAATWRRRAAALARWAGLGCWAGLFAVGLFAVQLLPTAEATRLTTRAVSGAVPDPPNTVVRALVSVAGPLVADETWEYHGGLGVVWGAVAALAPVLVRGRVRFQALVTAALVLFAVGGALLEELPVFRLFRIPPRMFLIAALPISLLAGTTTDALCSARPAPATLARGRRVALGVMAALLLGAGVLAVLTRASGQALRFHPYWAALALLIPAALWLPGRLWASAAWRVAWVAALLIDLWALAWPLVAVRPEAEVYAPTRSVRYLADHQAVHGRVLDRDVPGQMGNTPLGFAQPLLLRIEAVRGLNPIDVYRFKEYVQLISDRDDPPAATGGLVNFEIKDRALLDLMGTRYLLQPSDLKPEGDDWREVENDPRPAAFGNVVGGMQRLPPYTLYENVVAFPRAFVVAGAGRLPDGPRARDALKATDFRRTVLLEHEPPDPGPTAAASPLRPAAIREYRPNRVVIDVDGGAGFLVLTDVWFPGWTCTVDGRPAEVYRGDYVFRAVSLPEGAREVVFRFVPDSYRLGKLISGLTLGLLAALTVLAGAWLGLRRRRPTAVSFSPET
jgi:hypothetical protein